MSVSQLQGTSWYIETLKTNDDRRNKNKCIYYRKKGCCSKHTAKCFGSTHCTSYRLKSNIPIKKENVKTIKKIKKKKCRDLKKEYYPKLFIKTGNKYSGFFTVKVDDCPFKRFVISKNLQKDTLLANEVYKHEINEEFNIFNYKVIVIKKNLIKE